MTSMERLVAAVEALEDAVGPLVKDVLRLAQELGRECDAWQREAAS